MTNIDPAIVEAAEEWFGEHLTYAAFVDCSDHDLALRRAPLIAAAVDAAEKRGAARVREAVERVHKPSSVGNWCHHDGQTWPCRTVRGMTEATP